MVCHIILQRWVWLKILSTYPDGKTFGSDQLIMRLKKLFIILFATNILIACSEGGDCFVADSVEKIEELHTIDTTYFLYLRTSGFNEKESFYELYNKEPTFDDCGKTDAKPISDLHVDTSVGTPVKLMIKNNTLSLLFSNNANDSVDLKKILIEVKIADKESPL